MTKTKLNSDDVEWIGVRFLDPISRSFLYNDTYYRAIYPEKQEQVLALLNSTAIQELIEEEYLVEFKESKFSMDEYPLILESKSEYFQVHRSLWNALFIKEAAERYCDMNIILCRHGLGLIDGHGGNFIWQQNARPTWCDLGSIQEISKDSLAAVDEFIRHFVYPLLIRSISPEFTRLMQFYVENGCGHTEAHFFTKSNLHSLKGNRLYVFSKLKDLISSIDFNYPKTTWSDYHDNFDFSTAKLTDGTPQARKEIIAQLIHQSKPKTVIDYGSNAGFFSIMSAKLGAEVLAYELDEEASAKCYNNFRKSDPSLKLKVAMSGIHNHKSKPAEMVLALALTHHLFFTHKFSFEVAAKMFAESTSKYLLTEFMPNGLGIGKPHMSPFPPGYDINILKSELEKHFSKVRIIHYPNYTNRILLYAIKE